MSRAQTYIQHLELIPHPEGGFYKETYRADMESDFEGFDGKRNVCTAIYFLLENDNKSHFHKIKSDELWFHHDGDALEIFVLSESGLQKITLGKSIENGEVMQAVIPANVWFASKVKDNKGFALVSCTVSPGFDFADFEMATKKELLENYPNCVNIINEMCL